MFLKLSITKFSLFFSLSFFSLQPHTASVHKRDDVT